MRFSVIEGFTVGAPSPETLDRFLNDVLATLNDLGAVDADVLAALATGASRR